MAEIHDFFVARVNAAWADAGFPNIQVTSYFRTPAVNRAAGGNPQSQHLFGLAVDTWPRHVGFEQAAMRAGLAWSGPSGSHGQITHTQLFRRGFLASRGIVFPT